MRNIYFIDKLDLLALFYLATAKLKKNLTIIYRKKTKKTNRLIWFLTKFNILKFEQFYSDEINTGANESNNYNLHFNCYILAKKINSLYFKDFNFVKWLSPKIDQNKCSAVNEQALTETLFPIVAFDEYIKKNKSDKTLFFICCSLSDIFNIIKKEFNENSFKFIKIPKLSNFIILRIIINILRLSNNYIENIFISKKLIENIDEKKIAIDYNFEIDGPLSEIWWLDKVNIKKSNIIYYFDKGKKIANRDVINSITNKGFSFSILNKRNNHLKNIKTDIISIDYKEIIFQFVFIIKNYKNFLFFKWHFLHWLKVIYDFNFYKNFIKENNIEYIIDYADASIDIAGLAILSLGRKKIGYQRSEMYHPLCHFRPIHSYYFTWGSLGKDMLHKTGFINSVNIGNIYLSYPHLDEVKRNAFTFKKNMMKKNDNLIYISVFDRSSDPVSWITVNSHIYFYDKILKLAEKNNIHLIIKPKNKKFNNEILLKNDIKKRICLLISLGKITLLDSDKTPYEASIIADFSISLGINSAGIIGMLSGIPAFQWNPLNYEKCINSDNAKASGLDENYFVSNNLSSLLDRMQNIINDPALIKKMLINEEHCRMRNHFNDKNAYNRIAQFMNNLIKQQ